MADRISLVINDLKEELREVQRREAMLQTTISNLETLTGAHPHQPPATQTVHAAPTFILSSPTPTTGPYSNMTIAQAAIQFLVGAGKPQKTRIIADVLKQGGSKSTNHYRAVYNGLLQQEKLVYYDKENSSWGMREWRRP